MHVQGFPIGAMTIEEAAVALTQNFHLTDNETITLNYLDISYSLKPEEIGISLDAVRTAMAAYQFGHGLPLTQWLWQQPLIFARHIEIAPLLILDENIALAILQEISLQEDQPVKEASLQIKGTQVISTQGQAGQSLDMKASLEKIANSLSNLQINQIDLPVTQVSPNLMVASEFIPMAQNILNEPFIIYLPESADTSLIIRKWTIAPENLAPMLTFIPTGDKSYAIKVQIIDSTLVGLLDSIAEKIDTEPQNSRFIFNDETHELDLYIEGLAGITVDIDASMRAIQTALAKGNNKATLALKTRAPEVGNFATAEELGITELIHMENSYFYGSDSARVHNIETAANEFLGVLVKPGETFSMAGLMRDITLDNGYSEALIIFNGKTIEGIGGGVCQVSTTLFRAAFFAGFPINERHPHAYRVSYYEKVSGNHRDPNLAGLDATVFIPLIDLKFTNNSPYWLLMEAYVNKAANRITWKFYSTYDGRIMQWATTGLTNKVEPEEPIYQLNTDLSAGEIKQIDWEAEGADVTVSRIVFLEERILFEDSFFTRYAPWQAVYEYGPGTDGIPTQKDD